MSTKHKNKAPAHMQEHLLNEVETASRLGLSVYTLQAWRSDKGGNPRLPFLKIGRLVRYRSSDIAAFMK